MTRQELRATLADQLAIDFGCQPEDFFKQENIIVPPAWHPDRRHYSEKPFFFQMATLGQNAVIAADERMHRWLKDFYKDRQGAFLFEHPNLISIDTALRQYGYALWQTHHLYLPDYGTPDPKPDFEVRWLEQEDIFPLYEGERFENALCTSFLPKRPDMLAVAAMDGEKIVGLAGCSADTPLLWQIGIDVDPAYRSKKIGQTLVLLLKNEIIRRGKIPFYGTSLSNIHSQNIARDAGFFPAWVEVENTTVR